MKKIFVRFLLVNLVIFIGLVIYTNDMQMNDNLELRVPILTKRETDELQDYDIFTKEILIKIHLSKLQAKIIKNKIDKNENWKNTKLDERIDERMSFFSYVGIYDKIPKLENAKWISTNMNNGIPDKHSIDYVIENHFFRNIGFGILDLDNNILYYYQYNS